MALRGFVDSFRPRQTGKENLKTAKQTPKTLPTAPNGLGGPQEASKRPREVHDSSPYGPKCPQEITPFPFSFFPCVLRLLLLLRVFSEMV